MKAFIGKAWAWLCADRLRAGLVVLCVVLVAGALVGVLVGRRPAATRDTVKVDAAEELHQRQLAASLLRSSVVSEEHRTAVTHRDVRREERRPDGTTVVETTAETTTEGTDASAVEGTVAETRTAAAVDASASRHEERTHEERRSDLLRLHADARWDALDLRLVPELNADATVRVAGPLRAGAWVRRESAGRVAYGALVSFDLGW